MTYIPLTLARRHVLGELYGRCERATKELPVYLNDANGERLGHVDESMGKYADAYTFHVPEDVCKKLAGGQYTYSFDFHFSQTILAAATPAKRRISLISIILKMRPGREKPVANSADA